MFLRYEDNKVGFLEHVELFSAHRWEVSKSAFHFPFRNETFQMHTRAVSNSKL